MTVYTLAEIQTQVRQLRGEYAHLEAILPSPQMSYYNVNSTQNGVIGLSTGKLFGRSIIRHYLWNENGEVDV